LNVASSFQTTIQPERAHMPLPPTREPTSSPLDLELIWDLGDLISERVPARVLSSSLVAEIAAAAQVPQSHVYVAAGLDPMMEWTRHHAVAFYVCTGGCQAWGAVEVLSRLIEMRDERDASEAPSFDILPRGCVNLCDRAAAVVSTGPHGQAVHPELKVEQLDEIVDVLLSE
jgi:NADH:ubiquinone oxidoreductase subunit E